MNKPDIEVREPRPGFYIKKDRENHFYYSFDQKTGRYVRSNQYTEKWGNTDQEVFWSAFPHLIDVGVMGHCTHGKSGLCLKSGVQCYQDGLHISEPNMSIDDFQVIATQCAGFTNQFALGGRGDPNEHENFEEILRISRENNIIPNYTTSGFGLTDDQIKLSKQYCGAVAVSWYRNSYTYSSIQRLIAAKIKTNIHYVLNTDTIDEALRLLKSNGFPEGINAVVFLLHKPVGLGERSKCLVRTDPRVNAFFDEVKRNHPYKMGVDGCIVVGMVDSGLDFDLSLLDTCEAARFTCYIDNNLQMFPCSFDKNIADSVDLHRYTIYDGWHSKTFERIRTLIGFQCKFCPQRENCLGGCFLYPEIVLCQRKEKYNGSH
jgi:radical SAM protein with 4Fe4S-binding SPASM domain